MRLLLASLMAVTLAAVTTADLVACTDGCTDEVAHDYAAPTTPSLCTLCHGWNGPTPAGVVAPAVSPTLGPPTAVSHELPAHLSPIDHPPRDG